VDRGRSETVISAPTSPCYQHTTFPLRDGQTAMVQGLLPSTKNTHLYSVRCPFVVQFRPTFGQILEELEDHFPNRALVDVVIPESDGIIHNATNKMPSVDEEYQARRRTGYKTTDVVGECLTRNSTLLVLIKHRSHLRTHSCSRFLPRSLDIACDEHHGFIRRQDCHYPR
jgi:hypothetical protein